MFHFYTHSRIQSKSDSVQTLWAPQKISPKQKSDILFNEVGNKLNKNKGLRYSVKNQCPQISFRCDTDPPENVRKPKVF